VAPRAHAAGGERGLPRQRVAYGDWQTPLDLARQVVALVRGDAPAVVVEPTCGSGAFLVAAAEAFPHAALRGLDVSAPHVRTARRRLPRWRSVVERADFFATDWVQLLARLPAPLMILGNPPWVTNATLGTLEVGNLPTKHNTKQRAGLDALTGASNFDISEWMLLRLLEAARPRAFTLAMLCKASVARRVMEHAAVQRWRLQGETRGIDARRYFAASVDAVLLHIRGGDRAQPSARWPIYASLVAERPSRTMGVVAGRTYSDLDGYHRTRKLEGESTVAWRSGLKHDCARVMELAITRGTLQNGLGQAVQRDPHYVFPLLKGSDLANGRSEPRRYVIVTQRRLGEDTADIRSRSPALWRYLQAHRAQLAARRSRIYRDRPQFAMFGVGDYSFSPYKVAICGLYKRFTFTVVEPFNGQPVMLDDTAYFVPCSSAAEAATLASALNGPAAHAFFEARVFWDAKRPITKALLQTLSLEALLQGPPRAR
jgi:hypothetical protein